MAGCFSPDHEQGSTTPVASSTGQEGITSCTCSAETPANPMTSTADAQDSARDAILQQLLDELVTAAVDSITVTPGSETTAKGAVDAICRPSRPDSSITSLKEGVDCSCDREFGVESLEADGPADSWLVNADLSSAGTIEAAGQRVICKGPSWDGFVSRMKSQTVEAASQGATAEDNGQQGPTAAGLASGATSSTNDLFPTPTSAQASRSNSSSLRRQSSKQQSSRTESGKLLSAEETDISASAAVSDMAASDGATAPPRSSSEHLSRSSRAQTATTSSSRPSLSGPDSGSAETPAKTDLPAVTGAASAATAPAAPAAEDASKPPTQTPVREPRSSGGGAAQDAENAAWMASLRKGSASDNPSRRFSRSQSLGGGSPATPNGTSSKLTNTRSAKMSAPGPSPVALRTPASAGGSRSTSKKTLSASTSKGGETPGPASRTSSGKHTLRQLRPGTSTSAAEAGDAEAGLSSGPTSPVLSPDSSSGDAGSILQSAFATPAAAGGKALAGYCSNSSRKSSEVALKPKAAAAGSGRSAKSPRSSSSSHSATSPRPVAPAKPAGASAAGPGYSKKAGAAIRPKQSKVGIPGKKKPKQVGESSSSSTIKASPAVAEAQAAAAIAAVQADQAAESAAAAQQNLAEYTKTLETVEQLKRQAEAAAGAARVTADSASDVPLHMDHHTDEQWATDTTAIQLFMDEYKDAIEAVDSAVDRVYSAKLVSGAAVVDTSSNTAASGETGAGMAAEASAAGILRPEAAKATIAELAAQQAGGDTTGEVVPAAEDAAAPGKQQQQAALVDSSGNAVSQAAASVVADAMAAAAKNALLARVDEDAARRADSAAGAPQQHQQAAAAELGEEETQAAPACGCRCTIM